MAVYTEEYGDQGPAVRRYRVRGTGETGLGVSTKDGFSNVGRNVTIGDQVSVFVIDLCLDESGEIKTYRHDRLEELPPE